MSLAGSSGNKGTALAVFNDFPVNQPAAVYAEIDLGALASNVRLMQQIAGSGKQLIASIKANSTPTTWCQ